MSIDQLAYTNTQTSDYMCGFHNTDDSNPDLATHGNCFHILRLLNQSFIITKFIYQVSKKGGAIAPLVPPAYAPGFGMNTALFVVT